MAKAQRRAGLIFAAAVLTAGVVAVGLRAERAEAARRTVGAITYLEGSAKRKPTRGGWRALSKGAAIQQGDRIKTGEDSRLEARLHDGSMLRLGGDSELSLDKIAVSKRKPKKKKVSVKLFLGKVWSSVTSMFGDDSNFEVSTENAVAGVRGTRFEASVGDDGSTTVKVHDGKVLVSNKPIYAVKGHTKGKRVEVPGPQPVSKKQWEELVAGAMQMIQVASNGSMSKPEQFEVAADDDWAAWNAERDEMAGLHQDE